MILKLAEAHHRHAGCNPSVRRWQWVAQSPGRWIKSEGLRAVYSREGYYTGERVLARLVLRPQCVRDIKSANINKYVADIGERRDYA